MFSSFIIGALSGIQLAQAYSSSLSDCQTFAALFGNSCGGVDDDAVYTTTDWSTTGAGATVLNCSGDDEVFVPTTGASAKLYTSYARNCMTCREVNGDVLIRY